MSLDYRTISQVVKLSDLSGFERVCLDYRTISQVVK